MEAFRDWRCKWVRPGPRPTPCKATRLNSAPTNLVLSAGEPSQKELLSIHQPVAHHETLAPRRSNPPAIPIPPVDVAPTSIFTTLSQTGPPVTQTRCVRASNTLTHPPPPSTMPPPAAAAAAPAAAPPPPVETDAEGAKLGVWKEALYERCRDSGSDMFSQDELLRLEVIPNRDLLLLARVVQSLSDDKLFITMREASGQVLWKWRDAQEAHKYKQCSSEEQVMVYSLIDDSGGDGIWSQTLQKRLNMHDSVLKNALKHLQTKGLIAPFKNVEHPNKKMYIKASIRPSDRATGGPWYTDQNLDVPFIQDLHRVIFDYVKKHSSYHSKHGSGEVRTQVPKKGVLKGGVVGKKRGASHLDEPPSKMVKTSAAATPAPKKDALLPLPAGYTAYPTVREIARFISTSGVATNTVLTEIDVKNLINVLVWDNLLEPIKVAGKVGYRICRIARQSAESWSMRDDVTGESGGPEPFVSPLTEAPCGRCPVFELCEEGGPVGPSNCEYFQKWLGDE
ncbi:hypothetical protein G7046_g8882 [Stylonectria norvegica]|nr:hypothetical protein G7046_g8882 [Stylonectria norvegica]